MQSRNQTEELPAGRLPNKFQYQENRNCCLKYGATCHSGKRCQKTLTGRTSRQFRRFSPLARKHKKSYRHRTVNVPVNDQRSSSSRHSSSRRSHLPRTEEKKANETKSRITGMVGDCLAATRANMTTATAQPMGRRRTCILGAVDRRPLREE